MALDEPKAAARSRSKSVRAPFLLFVDDEVAGRESELLGMPLGFPPIPMERIRLLDTWIRQGMPE